MWLAALLTIAVVILICLQATNNRTQSTLKPSLIAVAKRSQHGGGDQQCPLTGLKLTKEGPQKIVLTAQDRDSKKMEKRRVFKSLDQFDQFWKFMSLNTPGFSQCVKPTCTECHTPAEMEEEIHRIGKVIPKNDKKPAVCKGNIDVDAAVNEGADEDEDSDDDVQKMVDAEMQQHIKLKEEESRLVKEINDIFRHQKKLCSKMSEFDEIQRRLKYIRTHLDDDQKTINMLENKIKALEAAKKADDRKLRDLKNLLNKHRKKLPGQWYIPSCMTQSTDVRALVPEAQESKLATKV